MYRWNEAIQKMIYYIEDHLADKPTLLDMSKQLGYSPYYCSTQFHEIVGMTLKNYISGRRLAKAAIALRDSEERILDIALQYGYSSQEALTRAFVSAFGCTPAVYRKNPVPIAISHMFLRGSLCNRFCVFSRKHTYRALSAPEVRCLLWEVNVEFLECASLEFVIRPSS